MLDDIQLAGENTDVRCRFKFQVQMSLLSLPHSAYREIPSHTGKLSMHYLVRLQEHRPREGLVDEVHQIGWDLVGGARRAAQGRQTTLSATVGEYG